MIACFVFTRALPSSIGMTNVFAPSFPYSTQITSSGLSIMLSKGINPANITGLNITTRELFYSFALNQYYNYFFSQSLTAYPARTKASW
jgi:hypothetical protein